MGTLIDGFSLIKTHIFQKDSGLPFTKDSQQDESETDFLLHV